ncbi:TRAP transporter small permease [Hoeflea sp.]|uniref:TRAP transporter small permease n=1 Tax=Hoeflea sp. TaxID=1940281 RepID=UPI0019842375|nr:TRAP transporter small permease [Hoeflea sp.]MBC7281075.1 TRAP transporter small permease [Hoeflea sp.]
MALALGDAAAVRQTGREYADMSESRILRAEALVVRLIGILLGLGLLAMVFVNVANAAGRYSGLFGLVGADELLVYGMIWIVMLGAILAARDRDHLSINLLPSAMKGRPAAALQVAIDVATVTVSAFIAWHSFNFIERIAGLNQSSMGLGIPMIVPHSAILVGFTGIAAVTALLTIVDIARFARAEGAID